MSKSSPGGGCEEKGIPVGITSSRRKINQIMVLLLDVFLRPLTPLRSLCLPAIEGAGYTITTLG